MRGRIKAALLTVIILFSVYYLFDISAIDNSLGQTPIQDSGTISVHFCPVENCEQIVLDELASASKILCAFYDLDLPSIQSALLEKDAEVLIFEDNAEDVTAAFTRVGSKGLMHNKFCILDDKRVITGSMNPTQLGTHNNDNNLLIIESTALAKNYHKEYAELLTGTKQFQDPLILFTDLDRDTTYEIENYFCPEDHCESEVLEELSKAQDEIVFMTFTFTSDPIGDLLAKKAHAGIDVQGVFEARQKSQWWEFEKLETAGANITTDGNPNTMHHKVFIIDPESPERATVVTGSFNPTAAANEKNDENILIIHDQVLAQEYVDEYRRVSAPERR